MNIDTELEYKQIIKLNYDNNLWNEHLSRLHLRGGAG